MKADLHVHSWHSGYNHDLPFLRSRDCYTPPEVVYRTAKARGMDLVTITDHDSIDGCLEFLTRHPGADDFFVSEEIECVFPDSPLKVHIGAYQIDETVHREIQPLRRNVFEAVAYLRQRGVFFALNHPFFYLRRQLSFAQYLDTVLPLFFAYEVRNGTMMREHNLLTEDIVAQRVRAGTPLVAVGGSDAHTLAGIASSYTEAPGRNADEFLQNLRAGRARVGGRHGSVLRVAREIYGVVFSYWASLLGFGRRDLNWRRRAIGIGFSVLTLPGEFVPILIAANKLAEARRASAFRREWVARPADSSTALADGGVQRDAAESAAP